MQKFKILYKFYADVAIRVPLFSQVQRHLQMRIEAQGKYLQAVLEKAQESLGKQNMGTFGLEAAKVQLSDLVSQVSTQCLNSAFSGMKELSDLCLQQAQTTQPTDCSVDSCLTSCEGTMRDQELYNNPIGLKPINFRAPTEPRINDKESSLQKMELRWHEGLKEGGKYLSKANDNVDNAFVTETNLNSLSMSIGLQDGKWNCNGNYPKERFKGAEAHAKFFYQNTDSNDSMKPEKQKSSPESKLPFFSTKLDLNIDDEKDVASGCKQLDLNGFSWSWEASIISATAQDIHRKKIGLDLVLKPGTSILLWGIIIQITKPRSSWHYEVYAYKIFNLSFTNDPKH